MVECPKCGSTNCVYTATAGAPGYGKFYKCNKCGEEFLDGGVLTPGDVR